MPAQTYLMRVWLPDRPGVLGAVATRLGAVKGDLLGIDIVERGGGMVIDELLISLPDDAVIGLMIREVTAVEDVRIEDVRLVESSRDPAELTLDACATIVEWPLRHPAVNGTLAELICQQTLTALRCSWTAVVNHPGVPGRVLASAGIAPAASWLVAYASGAHHARSTRAASGTPLGAVVEPETDTFCIHLDRSDQMLVLGRDDFSFLQGDRRKAQAIGRVADALAALHPPTAAWSDCGEEVNGDLLATPG